ncbi:DNA repair exonuclease [Imhoffiella purpurea]|uniref:DNA repair exonuclease family protein YhaO n=1 Tax=Imhoffiella purpurea TaxID=1249627 RepID=W9VHX7_9GAMM|nr:DNA repair exonuclease [Imhoffiella purpurea]EXJ16611.1 DNA repair exonuclease family protein YhaO [Imhoffiella purpurea]
MKFIHASDIHLDSPLRGLERYDGAPVEEIRGATRRACENLIRVAIDERVDFLLLAGDIYDGDWRDYNTGLFFARQLARLKEAGIPVFMVAGNHDAESRISRVLQMPANVRLFGSAAAETARLEDLGVAIHGQSFQTPSVTEDLSLGYPPAIPGFFNIGLLHTSLDGRPGHAPYAPCRLDGLLTRGYDYWALGHVHRYEVVAEDPWVVYAGNLQGRHVREPGAKGCVLVSVEDGRLRDLSHRSLDVLRWQQAEVDLGDAETLTAVLERIEGALEAALSGADGRLLALRLRLGGRTLMHARLHAEQAWLVAECRARALELGAGVLWLEQVRIETRAPATPGVQGAAEDALGGLLAAIDTLELDADRLSALSGEVADLAAKLPADLMAEESGARPTDLSQLPSALEDVKALLVERLLEGPSGTAGRG